MGGRADPSFGDSARRVVEEASQRILRNMDVGRPGGPAAKANLTKLGESAARMVNSARSARPTGSLGHGPVQAAFGAIEMAFGVVEVAAGASRRLASRVLGKEPEPSGLNPGTTSTSAAAFGGRPGPSTGVVQSHGQRRVGLAAGTSSRLERPRTASVASPILGRTDWAGRGAGAGSVSVSPGGTARVPIRIENRTDRAIHSVRLRSTDFVGRGGYLIDDTAVRIDPRVVDLQPTSAQTVVVEIHVPIDAGRGRYTGVVTALGLPQSGSTVELNVR